jgi:hypothetical protein
LSEWPEQAEQNTTCCTIDDLAFTAADPIVYATARKDAPSATSLAKTYTIVIPRIGGASTSSRSASNDRATSSPSASSDRATSSGTAPTATSTNEPQDPPSSNSSATRIALGIGITFGALIILGVIGFFFWRRRRNSRARPSGYTAPNSVGTEDEMEETVYTHGAHEMEGEMKGMGATKYARNVESGERHELPDRKIDPAELPAGNVHAERGDR